MIKLCKCVGDSRGILNQLIYTLDTRQIHEYCGSKTMNLYNSVAHEVSTERETPAYIFLLHHLSSPK